MPAQGSEWKTKHHETASYEIQVHLSIEGHCTVEEQRSQKQATKSETLEKNQLLHFLSIMLNLLPCSLLKVAQILPCVSLRLSC